MAISILINIASSILYELLKLPLSKFLEQSPLQEAISRTAKEFDDIEGITKHLEAWLEREETRAALRDLLGGRQGQIDVGHLSNILVEKVGFYYGQESQERAAEIIQMFLRFLLEEVLISKYGHVLLYQEHEETQRMLGQLGRVISDIDEALAEHRPLAMTRDDWSEMLPADRKLLTDANVKLMLLPESSSVKMHFTVSFESEKRDRWRIVPGGEPERLVDVPWKVDSAFGVSLMEFTRMASEAAVTKRDRAELHSCAVRIGKALGAALLTDEERQRIKDASGQDGPPPLVTVESEDDLILSLPWELLWIDGEFALKEGRIDLARCAVSRSKDPITLSPPDRYLKLVVNVSSPEGPSMGHLAYEAESYRIIRALHDYSEVVFTELGAADDLVNAVAENDPIGVHFSGHGAPGMLLFEDDEGMEDPVAIDDLLTRIRTKSPGRFPRFFYLASCHGNTPPNPEAAKAGSSVSAAQLHREGVVQVIGYYGPIVDELSTLAEAAVYSELAAGRSTRHGVRQARARLAKGPEELAKGIHRGEAAMEKVAVFPFAWAQLVFYHRGPDYPLSLILPEKYAQGQEAKLQRSFEGTDRRRILSTGFIGRRRELHQFQRACRERRVFVFQGLGGLGKSTLSFRALPMLARRNPTLTIWCHELEKEQNQARELTNRLSEFGRELFGAGWMDVVQTADRAAGATEPQRFGFFLQQMLALLEIPPNPPLGKGGTEGSAQKEMVEPSKSPFAKGGFRGISEDEAGHQIPPNPPLERGELGSLPLERGELGSLPLQRGEPGSSALQRGRIGQLSRIVVYLDNMESLLHGPDNDDPEAFGDWRSREVQEIWGILRQMSGDRLAVVGSCRYRNPSFNRDIIHVPEMTASAIFRMMGWFDGLRRLSVPNREKLVRRLHGHPRAVEFLEDLIAEAIAEWEDRHGEWVAPATEDDVEREWTELVEPALPTVEEQLRQDLLLDRIWERVLDEGCRRMLFRMTLLQRPWDWDLMMQLGEPGEDAAAEETAQRLRKTSLVEQVQERSGGRWVRLYQIHPATARFIAGQLDEKEAAELRLETYRRVGTYLEKLAETSPDIRVRLDAGHYLFECGEFDRALQLLGPASQAFQEQGMVRQGIAMLERFEPPRVMERMDPQLCGQMLGTLGTAYHRLGQVEKAIGYYQRSLDISKDIGDRRREGVWLGNLGLAYADLGQVEKAVEHYQRSLDISKDIGDRGHEGIWLGNLGAAYCRLGQTEKAIEYHQQALDILREIGDREDEGAALGNLGNVYADLGQMEKAIEYHQQALVIAREIGDRRGEGNQLGNLGLAYADLGQMGKAIEYLQQALEIQKDIGDRRGEGNTLGNLGLAYARLGQVEKARGYLEAALAIAIETKDPRVEAFVRGQLEKLKQQSS